MLIVWKLPGKDFRRPVVNCILNGLTDISKWFADSYSVQFRNYPVADASVENPESVPCGAVMKRRKNPDEVLGDGKEPLAT